MIALESKKNQIRFDLIDEDDPDERQHLENLIETFDETITKMIQQWRE